METNQITTAPLVKEILLDAPVHRVWKAITNNDDFKHWYFDIKEFQPVVGFEFRFLGENEGRKFVHICKVREVIENKKISYTWTYESFPEAETLVTWELFAEGNKTKLRLTHEGLEQLPQDRDYQKSNFVAGWDHIIGTSLKEYVGVPSSTIELSVDIKASDATIWDVLLQPEFVVKWAEAFMPGIHVESDWKKGSEVLWKDKDENVFVKGIVLANEARKFIEIGFYDDPSMSKPAEPGRYHEKFTISDKNEFKSLALASGPVTKQDSFEHREMWEKALEKIKHLAEK